MIQTIQERHRPRSLSAYVRAMPNADLLELLGEVRGKTRNARDLSPPCGECGPNRQITLPDGRPARCPRCHPLTANYRTTTA